MIKYIVNCKLPKLAWTAEVSKCSGDVVVTCGAKVECRDSFFVAGAWSGNFEDAGFDTSEVFYGTGAKITDNGIQFSTPSHALERLLLAENDKCITVSNSLPYILTMMEYDIDDREDQYEAMLCSILDGVHKYKKVIPLKDGKSVNQYIVSNILINKDMGVETGNRPRLEEFTSFENYYSRLMNSFVKLRDNAQSMKRRNSYFGIVTTISSGYDSTACSVIAKHLGCNTAVSLSGGKYDDDDGQDIARKLGYAVIIKKDKDEYKDYPGVIDAEYICSGEMAVQMQFCVFQKVFEDSMVFYGARGSYFDKRFSMTDDFEMKGYFYYETDISWTENALKMGYLNVPVPAYGASVCQSVRRISNSLEMKPWSIGGQYDKPIPRRIVEEAGIERSAFGQIKYGGGFSLCYDSRNRLYLKMSKEGYASFNKWCSKGNGVRKSIKRGAHTIEFYCKMYPTYIGYVLSKFHIKASIVQKPSHMSNPRIQADLFMWSMDVMKKRYRGALLR